MRLLSEHEVERMFLFGQRQQRGGLCRAVELVARETMGVLVRCGLEKGIGRCRGAGLLRYRAAASDANDSVVTGSWPM
jgi:hypothetical protein